MRRLSNASRRKETGAKYPHCVDLIPPPEGFADSVEEEIIQFLERRSGTFDLYGEIANGDAFIRYCFEHEADAEAFHAHFAPAAEKAISKKPPEFLGGRMLGSTRSRSCKIATKLSVAPAEKRACGWPWKIRKAVALRSTEM